MPESRKILLRACAIGTATIVLAAATACNSVKAPLGPNPGKPVPGKQDMFVVVGNGAWDLVGFTPTLTATTASGSAARVPRSGPVMSNRASVGTSAASDSVSTTFVITGPPKGTDLVMPTYEAFDKAGNAWMSVRGTAFDGAVIEYGAAQQKTGDSIPPAVALGGLQYPEGLAFDATGNLWVLDAQADRLVEYTRSQLTQSGAPVPTTTVSLAALNVVGSTYAPFVLAIDRQGNFWVSANIQGRPASTPGDSLPDFVIAEFTGSQVAAGGTPTPVLTISMPGVFAGGYGPGLAFDSTGDLWTANADSGTLTQFRAASLTPGANPRPAIRIGGTVLAGISDVAIDPAGILLVATGYAFVPGAALYGYRSNQVATSGNPTPVIALIPADGVTHLAARP